MLNLFNTIMLYVDFNDPNAYQGTSIWPFISFLMFFAGILMVFIGFIIANTAKKQWNTFYDARNRTDEQTKSQKKKSLLRGRIVMIAGVVIFIASYFVK